MAKYTVYAHVTISASTEVEANSEEEAREVASGKEMPTLCWHCASAGNEDTWSVELDGSPEIQSVEPAS